MFNANKQTKYSKNQKDDTLKDNFTILAAIINIVVLLKPVSTLTKYTTLSKEK